VGRDGKEGDKVNRLIWDDKLHKRCIKDRKDNKSIQISDVCRTNV